jgi:hypothetical protein
MRKGWKLMLDDRLCHFLSGPMLGMQVKKKLSAAGFA